MLECIIMWLKKKKKKNCMHKVKHKIIVSNDFRS